MDNEHGWNEPNLAPTQVRRQHYVPRMYLRTFGGTDGRIRVIDLDTGNEYRTSVENVAIEIYFYDLEIEGVSVSTEDWLAEIEGKAAQVLQQLIDDPDSIISLSDEQEFFVARFIAALRFRTPAFREWQGDVLEGPLLQIKELAKAQLFSQTPEKEAETIWKEWKDKPAHWWWGQPDSQQPAAGAAYMLGEVQGFANLLRAMPWRIGQAPDSIRLYTSDNPVAGYLTPVRPWWEGGAFSSFTYFLPLSPIVLLKIERMRRKNDDESTALEPRGERRSGNFSAWDISFARHVVTREATRFLYGDGLIVPRDCATDCLERIGRVNLEHAIRYQGFDPRPPKLPDPQM